MIEALKDDKIIRAVGGRFKLTALMQKRWVELMQGARPCVEVEGGTELDVIAAEILQGKIAAEIPAPSAAAPEEPPGVVDIE
jgi:DNA-directed RNA polymerase subunit omega